MITTLLIVDDSEIDRRKYCCYLNSERPHTYLILETDNLEKAKEICAEKRTDAILLGLSLTDDSSLDFLNWMKQQGQIALLPTLLLTKQIDEYTAAQASKNGIQDYLIKEYLTSQRLVQSLDHLFERIRLINTISDALSLRKRAEELIAEGCEKFYNFLECSNDLIWSINLEGNFIYLSPQFQEL
jgi:DNA-binding NtrC family response regulator